MPRKAGDLGPDYEPVDPPVEPSSIDKLTAAIERMATLQMAMLERGMQAPPENAELMKGLTIALERVSDNQLKGAEVQAQAYRQVHRPSNEVAHERSVFHPRGNPNLFKADDPYVKPMLKCECWVPRPELPQDNMLTREETELLNILVRCPGAYVINRIDDTRMKIQVVVEMGADDVTPTRLILKSDTGFNNEYFRLLPALHSQLRQIFAQHPDPAIRKEASAVMTMDEENLLIKAGKLSIAA